MTRVVVATDNFNRASLGSNWANQNTDWGTVRIVSDTVFDANSANVNNEAIARWEGTGSFDADQYSEVTIGGLSFLAAQFATGVIVRASADTNGARDHYFAEVQHDSGGPNYTTVLGKVVNGTRAVLHSAAVAWANGDKISLEAEGTTLRLCKNGTALGGSFTQTDSDLSSGKPGILANGAGPTGDDWEGGDISSAVILDVDQAGSIAMSGALRVSGDIEIQIKRWRVPTNAAQGTAVHLVVFSGTTVPYAILAQGAATVDASGFAEIAAAGTIGTKALAVAHNFDGDTNTTSIFGGPCIAQIIDAG